jgi:hypothetical protein
MVLVSFHDMDAIYGDVRKSACESQSCSVMILVAIDVRRMHSSSSQR